MCSVIIVSAQTDTGEPWSEMPEPVEFADWETNTCTCYLAEDKYGGPELRAELTEKVLKPMFASVGYGRIVIEII